MGECDLRALAGEAADDSGANAAAAAEDEYLLLLEPRYAADKDGCGCMVLEGMGADDPEARSAAAACQAKAEDTIRRFVSDRHPEHADRLTDLVRTTMAGLSACARQGLSLERLAAVATLAGAAIAQALAAPATPAPTTKAGRRTPEATGSGSRARRQRSGGSAPQLPASLDHL